jgi:hypothetical protein
MASRAPRWSQLATFLAASLCAFARTDAAQSSTCSTAAAAAPGLIPQEVQSAQTVPLASAASLTRQDLPRVRPFQPWPYRSLSTVQSAPLPTTDAATGVTTCTVVHAPLVNVTVGMLVWWFEQDLEKVAPYIGDGQNHR